MPRNSCASATTPEPRGMSNAIESSNSNRNWPDTYRQGAEQAKDARIRDFYNRSEEHTSELQSRPHLVCRLLLEKKKNTEKKRHQCRYKCRRCSSRRRRISMTSIPFCRAAKRSVCRLTRRSCLTQSCIADCPTLI